MYRVQFIGRVALHFCSSPSPRAAATSFNRDLLVSATVLIGHMQPYPTRTFNPP